MERVEKDILRNIEEEMDVTSEPEILDGIADDGLRFFLEFALSKFKYRDDGVVIEQDAIIGLVPVIFAESKMPMDRRSIISLFSRRIMPLQRAELYCRYLVPDSDGKRSGRYVATEDSMINALSYLYIKEREDRREKRSLMGFECMLRTANALGDNPRSEKFLDAAMKSEGRYKKRLTANKPKRPLSSHKESQKLLLDNEYHLVWSKEFEDKKELSLSEKLSSIDAATAVDILGKVCYQLEIENNFISKKIRKYEHFGIDKQVGDVIEFIRRADKGEVDDQKELVYPDLRKLEAGLLTVVGYLKKYPNVINLNTLFEAVKAIQCKSSEG